ncbi:MAG: hypothetical protein GEU88_11435 [Solirubrobacterales bacterium]|nr:hypothetical protein [Solirubrobacterales bacterium]
MTLTKHARPSPAMIVAALALVVALGGTAIAAPEFATEKINKSKVKKIAKKQGKKQARKQIKKKAPGLSVANAENAVNAENATNATTAANGAAGYGNFTPTGAVQGAAFNMNNLTVSTSAQWVYCEDQAFKTVVVAGGVEPGGAPAHASAISKQSLADLASGPAALGCPANTEWVYATARPDGTGTPAYFQATGY